MPTLNHLPKLLQITMMLILVISLAAGVVQLQPAIAQSGLPETVSPEAVLPETASPERDVAPEVGTVILGQPCTHPYVVAIPTDDPAVLAQIQVYVPTAFLTDSANGRYVQAGSAPERALLSEVNNQLRQLGFDARIAYRPLSCPFP